MLPITIPRDPGFLESFWIMVDKSAGPDGCWLWKTNKLNRAYGQISIGGQRCYLHRVMWTITNGSIKPQMCILHECDNPPCINPRHLREGTQAENIADRTAKGRGATVAVSGSKNGNSKLSEEQVEAVRSAKGTLRSIAERFGVHLSTIGKIRTGASRARKS